MNLYIYIYVYMYMYIYLGWCYFPPQPWLVSSTVNVAPSTEGHCRATEGAMSLNDGPRWESPDPLPTTNTAFPSQAAHNRSRHHSRRRDSASSCARSAFHWPTGTREGRGGRRVFWAAFNWNSPLMLLLPVSRRSWKKLPATRRTTKWRSSGGSWRSRISWWVATPGGGLLTWAPEIQ